jgi:hypothetical protein
MKGLLDKGTFSKKNFVQKRSFKAGKQLFRLVE